MSQFMKEGETLKYQCRVCGVLLKPDTGEITILGCAGPVCGHWQPKTMFDANKVMIKGGTCGVSSPVTPTVPHVLDS